jgi:hypothetical protein
MYASRTSQSSTGGSSMGRRYPLVACRKPATVQPLSLAQDGGPDSGPPQGVLVWVKPVRR